ncbi:SUN domain-containing protein, partial [Flavobacteriaceae bacterium]|nr:SUN domain-containing protein [Flavobacteriaceae bacterium]
SPVTAYYYQEENMKSFDLFASNNGQEWTLLGQYDIGDPRDADGNIPSAAMDAAANGHDFELEGISDQFNYLKISITSNYGSDTYCHGSEITLYGLDNL